MSLQSVEAPNAASALPPLQLLEEFSYRVANEYCEAIATLRLAAAAAGNPQVGATLGAVAKRLRAHAMAHQAMRAPQAEGPIDLADHIAEVCAALTEASLAPFGVRLLVDADEIWLEAGRSWRVGLIVAELVRNAAHQGLDHGPGAIRVSLGQACGRVSCRVSATGGGAGEAPPRRGRRLVEALAAELGGSVDWGFTSAGGHARLEIPVAVGPTC